jgi:hypothetical protein
MRSWGLPEMTAQGPGCNPGKSFLGGSEDARAVIPFLERPGIIEVLFILIWAIYL